MFQKIYSRSLVAFAALCVVIMAPRSADATIVEIETNLGTFQVNLYDLGTPATVANFLAYVNSGAYDNSIIHRTVPGFVIQGGGHVTDMNAFVSAIATNPPVTNEPTYSNVRGTISMAKQPGNANSATSQWFFNLANNAASLDNDNGGYAVFGQVTGGGMATVDAIAAIPRYSAGVFAEIPLQNYTAPNPVVLANLVVVTEIRVIDTTVDSAGAAGLNPPLSTKSNGGGGGGGGNGGGGGSLGLLALLCLSAIARRRYRLAKTA